MSRRFLASALLMVVVAAAICQSAQAIPRWRRSRSYSYSGYVEVASKADGDSVEYPILSTYCDYEAAQEEAVAFTNKIRVAMNVWDDEILTSPVTTVAEVKVKAMNASDKVHVFHVPVSWNEVDGEEYKVATVDLVNDENGDEVFQPATVYQMFINLHRQADSFDEKSVFGQLPGAYYAATSGDSVIERARHKIVMRTFREWYYTERGWNRNAEYPMDCHAYYLWATGSCTVGATNGWTNLGAVFGTYHHGGHIAELMDADRIHGDYVRVPGHTFMLLAYDAELGQVWTMEANFNHTIEVCRRPVGSGWQVGHLEPEHIREGLFDNIADSGMSTGEVEVMVRAETMPETDMSMAQ